jgi:hypothetical protein
MRKTFEGLSQMFDVPIAFCQEPELRDLEGMIVLGNQPELIKAAAAEGIPCLVLIPAVSEPGPRITTRFRFSDRPSLPGGLRGEAWEEVRDSGASAVVPAGDEEPMGWLGDRLVWTRGGGGVPVYRAAVPFSAYAGDGMAASLAPGADRIAFIPLVHFLTELTAQNRWNPPCLSACFVFDDPNLRSMQYGWLNYQELVTRARELGCHASIGMVPLDGAATNSGVAELFREAGDCLSLCIHGNNHTYCELARCETEAAHRVSLAQALRRVRETESRHGVSFCRVMEAPHGVIHHSMFPALLSLGFDAATFTPGQFLNRNGDRAWPPALGWGAQESFPDGLCAIPRIVMSRRWPMEVGWAAWLGQPVVVAGHHWDADSGLGFLEGIASTLSRWGNVKWGRLSRVARACYLTRVESQLFVVKTASRSIWVDVPAQSREMAVERPWMAADTTAPLRIVERATGRVLLDAPCGRRSEPLQINSPTSLSVLSPPARCFDANEVELPRFRVWPNVRRKLSELRDRALPRLHRRTAIAVRKRSYFQARTLEPMEL